ncbi:hypothetical protein CMO89_04135 [Candidatus Woesearchaeota archaeon]|nr:hypothetical protein [Candidatus Woesearchaeota archaeon]|tara:strand:- start:8854 stop:9606 length:753 start_codon:yes stop_codon:yes gene_type:complete
MSNQQQIFQLLFNEDEVTWQSIIYELVRTEEIDPWDVDVSSLAKKYLVMLKKLKEMNFRVSGKVLLAAAILLKIKSNRLVGRDLDELDRLISAGEEAEGDLFDEEQDYGALAGQKGELPPLIPRTPQPRKRKVSIYDLMGALQKALEVKRRRVINSIPVKMDVPDKTIDISQVIQELYFKIKDFFSGGKKSLTFSNLIPSDKKEDKVLTFIPLLHLTNQRKVDLFQQQHFGEIEVLLRTKKDIDKELGAG